MAATFQQVQDILNTLADTQDPNARDQVYGRHDAQARFSWDDENALLSAVADPRGSPTRLIPYLDYSKLTPDEVKQKCTMLKMLIAQPGSATPAMPRLRPGTNRRYARPDEIDLIVAWLQTLPYPRADVAAQG
ncbi:MAG TPA: hypothetical protein VIF60_04655 [Burkholderiaceae bacterium]|jgi:hypothetical protein